MFRLLRNLFGNSSASRAAPKRRAVRLELERLDERMLPSATSLMSQVMDLHGNSAVFYIGKDLNLYEIINDGPAQKLTSSGNYGCVSAGLDTHGNAMAYMQQGDGNFDPNHPTSELDAWDAGRIMVVDPYSVFTEFSAAVNAERVYYLGGGWSAREANFGTYFTLRGVWSGFTSQQLGTSTDWVQVSAGTDIYGKDTAYFIFSDDHFLDQKVYAWSESSHQMWQAQNFVAMPVQVVGGRNGYFFCVDVNFNLWEQTPTGDRFGIVLDVHVRAIMGVGTNSEGAMTVNYERTDNTDMQYDTEYRYYWNMGSHTGVVAGEGGYNYYMGPFSTLHEIDPYGNDYVIANNLL